MQGDMKVEIQVHWKSEHWKVIKWILFFFLWISSEPVIIKGLDPGDVTCCKH